MNLELEGQLAVVTGAAQGIGLAVATALREEGARVLMVDRSDTVNVAAAEIGASGLVVDLADKASADHVAQASAKLGGASVLVNNAGVTRPGNIAAVTDDDWSFVLAVNLDAVFRMTRALWSQLQANGGAIVNMASFAGKRATLFGNNASYTVSKHGVAGLTRATAMDGAKVGIRVNAVAPGVVSTEMVKAHDAATREKIAGMIPIGRYAEPREIADAVLFLASRRASHITGEVMNVNGGLVMD